MFTVYILQSDSDKGFYIGCTGTKIENRLKKHNHGHVRSTKARRPWRLIYFEEYPDKHDAFKREFYLKQPIGYQDKLLIIKTCSELAQPQRGPFGVG